MICVYGIRWEKKGESLPEELRLNDMQPLGDDRPEPVISCDKDEIERSLTDWYGFNIRSVKGISYETEDGKRFDNRDEYEQYNEKRFLNPLPVQVAAKMDF